jgi:hypothetical protein
MTSALVQFDANLAQAEDLIGLAQAVDAATTSALDTSDLLRSALVAGVSAFDHYVHAVVSDLMIETASGARLPTDAFMQFPISAQGTLRAAAGDLPDAWMRDEIRRQHGHLSFQHPDKVADAVRLVWDQPLWQTIAGQLGTGAQDLKRELQLIVSRRNRIAHEADRDPTPPHDRWPISASDVRDSLGLIRSIVQTLDAML